jgi:hypothetical protein
LVRKKSGEIVKPAIRDPSRRRSSDPTGNSKPVQFHQRIEMVRYFSSDDCAIAVAHDPQWSPSAQTIVDEPDLVDEHPNSPLQWEIDAVSSQLESLERHWYPTVRLDKLFMSDDGKNLIGIIAVANVAYEKFVSARYTFDNWKTMEESIATYTGRKSQTHLADGYDRFQFFINLENGSNRSNTSSRSLLLCARYIVKGKEYWDNNHEDNFYVQLKRKSIPVAPTRNLEEPTTRRDSLSERYSIKESLRPRLQPETTKHIYAVTAEVEVEQKRRPKVSIYSSAYKEMVQKYCYFEPDKDSKAQEDRRSTSTVLEADDGLRLKLAPLQQVDSKA